MFHLAKPNPGTPRHRSRAAIGISTIALAVVGLLLSLVGGAGAATAVPLGTAGTYAVLAGSGISNIGATTIAGDTGSSPTSVESGFAACPGANCVSQTGANHIDPDPNDAATQAAKVALTNAYNVAAGQTPTTIPTDLAGQTLTAGVYTSASGVFAMTGTLTLNGGGDPNATFIFQTADGTGTLITGSTGNVSLIGSAQSCNLYWKVGSSATLGSGSTFRGNILANDSISLGAAVTVDGSLLAGEQGSGAGAVTLINDTITTATCAATPTPTPTPATTTAAVTTSPVTTAATPTSTTPSAAAIAAAAARAKALKAKQQPRVPPPRRPQPPAKSPQPAPAQAETWRSPAKQQPSSKRFSPREQLPNAGPQRRRQRRSETPVHPSATSD